MKLLFLTIAASLVLALPLKAQDLSTPESSVRSLLTAFCKGDISEAVNCVENAKYSALLDPMGRAMKLSPYSYTLSDVQSKVDGDSAILTMQVTLKQAGTVQVQQFISTVKLHHSMSGWQVLVNHEGSFQPGKPDPVNAAVRSLAEPRAVEAYLKSARVREQMLEGCVSNLTALSTAVLTLVQSHDRRYALNAENYQKFLYGYLPSKTAFRCPADRKGTESYSFNPKLVGVLYPAIKDPSTLVAIYEGRGGKLRFKHDGKAGIAFADGHVSMVTEEEAKTLRWEP